MMTLRFSFCQTRISHFCYISLHSGTAVAFFRTNAPSALAHRSLWAWHSPTRLKCAHWTGRSYYPVVPHNVLRRSFSAASASPDDIMNVFDRQTKRKQRNRTAHLPDYHVYDYLKDEVGWRMADRVGDVKRTFDVALDVGCGRGHVARHILQDAVGVLYQCDVAEQVLNQSDLSPEVPTVRLHVDEEHLPFRENMFDLVVSSMSMHWVNNLPGTLQQMLRILKNDGCLLGAMFGGETLHELRVALQLAETERRGGFAAHVSPFTSPQDLGSLLNRTGFAMLTLDLDEVVVTYPSVFELIHDLKGGDWMQLLFPNLTCVLQQRMRGMGESNCAWNRQLTIHRDSLAAAAAIYQEMYGSEDGVPATFQILYFIGWKPDKSQATPAERGSGQVSLKDIDKLDQIAKKLHDLKSEPALKPRLEQTISELEKGVEKACSTSSDDDDTKR